MVSVREKVETFLLSKMATSMTRRIGTTLSMEISKDSKSVLSDLLLRKRITKSTSLMRSWIESQTHSSYGSEAIMQMESCTDLLPAL